MSAVTNAVAKAENGIEGVITTYKPRIAVVLPEHINADQFAGLAMGALYRDPKVREAANNNPGAFMNALMRCASLGHQPGTEEFYLIPRKKKGVSEIQGIEGYRGIVERMYRSGAVASVVVREVCANDSFRFIEGEDDKPVHHIGGEGTTGADFFGANGSRSRGDMVGVYAYAKLMTGAISRVVILTRDDVMAAKASSDGATSDYSPWNRADGGKDHPEFTGRSMWWKTAARRLEPWVPTSAEYRAGMLRAAAEADNLRHTTPAPQPQAVTPADEVVEAEIVEEGGEWPQVAKPGGGE